MQEENCRGRLGSVGDVADLVAALFARREGTPRTFWGRRAARSESAPYRILRQDWKVEAAITEMKDGGYGYHSVWINLPRFIRKAAKELKASNR